MRPIHLQRLIGPAAGRRTTFEDAVITFGRADDCMFHVAEPYVSRHHGEIRFDADRWVLFNLSRAGTRVNRRNVTKKPRHLADGDVVGVGEHQIFQVRFDSGANSAEDHEPGSGDTASAGKHRMSVRAKLWAGLGIYVFVVFAFLIVASFFRDDGDELAGAVSEWTTKRIMADVTRAPMSQQPNDQIKQQRLETAAQSYAQRDLAKANLFRAYRAYQQARAFSATGRFDEPEQTQCFADARQELVRRVTEIYQDGYARLRSGQFAEADRTFRELLEIYPDPNSELFRHVEQLRNQALTALGRKRRRG